MNYTPIKELTDILLPAYSPCPGFKGRCRGIAKWKPKNGYVPIGFVGATSSLEEVEVVILFAEPGDPYGQDTFSPTDSPRDLLSQGCRNTFERHRNGTDLFHRNLRLLLNLIFPGLQFEEQLKRTWLTETYLCSAPQEGGNVPSTAVRECIDRYLKQQLALFEGLPVIALGGKAQNRARNVPNLIKAYSIAPPGCNHKPALPSWKAAAMQARKMIAAKAAMLGRGR